MSCSRHPIAKAGCHMCAWFVEKDKATRDAFEAMQVPVISLKPIRNKITAAPAPEGQRITRRGQVLKPVIRMSSPPRQRRSTQSQSAREVNTPTEITITQNPPSSSPCAHRSEPVGYFDCRCGGNRTAYQCSKFIRPNISPPSAAYCSERAISRPLVNLIDTEGRTLMNLTGKEILHCTASCEGYAAANELPVTA